jgi:hypothetical protein
MQIEFVMEENCGGRKLDITFFGSLQEVNQIKEISEASGIAPHGYRGTTKNAGQKEYLIMFCFDREGGIKFITSEKYDSWKTDIVRKFSNALLCNFDSCEKGVTRQQKLAELNSDKSRLNLEISKEKSSQRSIGKTLLAKREMEFRVNELETQISSICQPCKR